MMVEGIVRGVKGQKLTKERMVGVIGTHNDNDPNSYFAYIYTTRV